MSPTALITYPDYGTTIVFRDLLIILPLVISQQKPVFKLYYIYLTATITNVGRDSSVGIAARYGLDGPGIEFRCGRDTWHPSRTVLGPTQPPVKWTPGIFPKCRAAGVYRSNHPLLKPRLKKEQSYTSIPSMGLCGLF